MPHPGPAQIAETRSGKPHGSVPRREGAVARPLVSASGRISGGGRITNGVTTWGMTEGAAGMVSQVKGLAQAVGLPFNVYASVLRQPWRLMWPGLIPNAAFIFQDADLFNDPPPRLLITCGRQAVMAALFLKKRYGRRLFTVHIQDPRISTARFDLVVTPEHDGLAGANVIATVGAVHHITAEALASAAAAGPIGRLASLNGPFALVLLGGPNRYYGFSDADMQRLEDKLAAVVGEGIRLAILPSRRTPDAVLARFLRRFGETQFVWDRSDANPYLSALALATHIIATGDSVSMLSEASATGKPLFVEYLTERRRARRFRRFHESFEQAGVTRPFEGRLAHWEYTPRNDTASVARTILERMS